MSDVEQWPIWCWFSLVSAKASSNNSVFGFAEYLATLALLLVVITVSDFKYRYRLAVHRYDLRNWSFWVALGIGIAILLIDIWFENALPIPRVLNNANNLKAIIGLAFVILVFFVVYAASVRSVSFARSNARYLFDATRHFIQQGNPERMVTIAEELAPALPDIIAIAAKIPHNRRNIPREEIPIEQACAHDFLLLIADERFCRIIVDKAPEFAIRVVWEIQQHPRADMPVSQFARNIGHEFIRNVNSAFYQEESGFATGLFGYEKPITNILFGTYAFVENCAHDGGSPLGVTLVYREFSEFDAKRMDGFCRAALAFLASYLKTGSGTTYSRAVLDLFRSFESVLSGTYRIGEAGENYGRTPEYERLRAIVSFASEAMDLLEKNGILPHDFRNHEFGNYDIYDHLSTMIFDIIFTVSTLDALPVNVSWQVQYGVVWGRLFGFGKGKAHDIVRLKIRRAMYDQIKQMDKHPDFKAASILGYVLNIFGVEPMGRHDGFMRDFYPVQTAALKWMKKNYSNLLEEHPKVATACIMGSISYDADNHQLIKTYREGLGKGPHREFFKLDKPPIKKTDS